MNTVEDILEHHGGNNYREVAISLLNLLRKQRQLTDLEWQALAIALTKSHHGNLMKDMLTSLKRSASTMVEMTEEYSYWDHNNFVNDTMLNINETTISTLALITTTMVDYINDEDDDEKVRMAEHLFKVQTMVASYVEKTNKSMMMSKIQKEKTCNALLTAEAIVTEHVLSTYCTQIERARRFRKQFQLPEEESDDDDEEEELEEEMETEEEEDEVEEGEE